MSRHTKHAEYQRGFIAAAARSYVTVDRVANRLQWTRDALDFLNQHMARLEDAIHPPTDQEQARKLVIFLSWSLMNLQKELSRSAYHTSVDLGALLEALENKV